MSCHTLDELLLAASGERGIRFIAAADDERRCSYGDLARNARNLLGKLQRQGLRPGAEILLQLDGTEAFVTVFWACILGRLIPIPLQPGRNDEQRLKLLKIWRMLERPHLVTDHDDLQPITESAARHGMSETAAALGANRTIFDGTMLARGAAPDPVPPAAPEDIAFVQFSSGSTGDPKGVVLTHAQIVQHCRDFAASAGMDASDIFLSWFPLTHDMGLIGWHLIPLLCGAEQCLMPTKLFVSRPSLWLAKTSEHRATVLCTNNFGLKHFAKLQRPGAQPGWDLSSVRLLFNAAEPISAELCREFLAMVQRHGLSDSALFPGYGLAEASLGVSFPVPGEAMRTHVVDRHHLGSGDTVRPPERPLDAITLVELGRAIDGVAIRVVDRDGGILGENRVGAVEIDSRSMTAGYYRNAEATAALFAPDGWLRTGDIGFLTDGRLVLTGRLKDIIIQAGHNYYPQDIERVAEEVAGIELGKVVACGVADPLQQRELLVVFVHHKKSLAEFAPLAAAVRDHLLRQAGWLVDHVVPVAAIPKTTSGKIQRYKLAERFRDGEFGEIVEALDAVVQPPSVAARRHGEYELVALLQREAEAVMGRAPLDVAQSLFEQGLDSIKVVALHARLVALLGIQLPVSLAFDRPSIRDIAAFVAAKLDGAPAAAAALPAAGDGPIAVIGIGCRFPGGADTPAAYWRLLADGVDAVIPLPPSRRGASQGAAILDTVEGGFLQEVAGFDNAFFGISVREAESLDPQARLLLEICWEALERAGQDIPALSGSETGVFVGISNSDYALAHFHSGDSDRIDAYSYTGTAPALAAGRIAHALGLAGPALAVDTACSSSLVAVHLAMSSLRAGECSMAIAGGVNLILSPQGHISLGQLGALSPTQRCRTFADDADGYVRGEGGGVVVLKPLAAAQAAGDPILAVLRGSATNHDGRSSGLTVPSGPAQAKVIQRALQRAGLAPFDIDYVEAHGTGTPLGDPIEVEALQTVFGDTARTGKLWIGSAKSNLGHLESAAGVAGLIKTILALAHETLPASLHVAQPSRHLRWDDLSVRIADRAVPWQRGARPRRAGVSAFGFSGTNAHVVVEEAPLAAAQAEHAATLPLLFPLSARSDAALRDVAAGWLGFLESHPEAALPGLAAATARRGHLAHRATCRFADRAELVEALGDLTQARPSRRVATGRARSDITPRLAFVFSGQGSQWAGMGRELSRCEPVFAAAIERCDALIRSRAGWSLHEALDDETRLRRTDVAQPAIFAIQYALTTVLAHYGVAPDAVVGHSCGEIAAFWASGMLSLEQALDVAIARGRLMQDAAGNGRMVAVRADAGRIGRLIDQLGHRLDIAAVNGPELTVVCGTPEAMAELVATLRAQHIACQDLGVDFAFHGRQMEAGAAELARQIGGIATARSSTAVYSTVTGSALREAALPAAYWHANVRQTVRFAETLQHMRREGCTHFLEIGPHPVLAGAIAETLGAAEAVVATLRRGAGAEAFRDSLGALHCEGFDLKWDRLAPGPPAAATGLPTYPWQRRHLWQVGFDPWHRSAAATPDPIAGLSFEIAWQRVAMPRGTGLSRPVLFAAPEDALARSLAEHLGIAAHGCRPEDFERALAMLSRDPPSDLILLLDPVQADPAASQRAACRAMLDLAHLALRLPTRQPPRVWLVTRGAQRVGSEAAPDSVAFEGAIAFARVLANEHPELRCTRLDLGRTAASDELTPLVAVLRSAGGSGELALRGQEIYAARLTPSVLTAAQRELRITGDGTYLVTGGTGSLGIVFARLLAARGARNLVLVGRGEISETARTKIAALREGGVRVELPRGDIASRLDVERMLATIAHEMPPLAGIVHAAGVLEDATVWRLDPATLDRVMAPKLDGAWNLHQATLGTALDFFIMLSTASVILGGPGQAGYAAANGFLDALSAHRNHRGLASLSLRLGIVAGSRMAGDGSAERGIGALSQDEITQAVAPLWRSGRPAATLLRFTAADWVGRHPTAANRDFFAALLPEEAMPQPDSALLLQQLRDLDSSLAVHAAICDALAEIVGAVVKLPAAEIELDRPLRELGVDSLMTLRVRTAITARFGCEMHVATFWSHPTIIAFARHLMTELGLADEAPAESPVRAPVAAASDIRAALAAKWEKYL